MSYIENPKTKGSGIIACIPQSGECPTRCEDCFFQSGRSYLELLEENLPNIPSLEEAEGRVVRMNDGNDSNNDRECVERVAQRFKDYFFNTSSPFMLDRYSGPVVLTVNPGYMTDKDWHRLTVLPNNLMFVRVRTNVWNRRLTSNVVDYYTIKLVPVVLTYMVYYTTKIPSNFSEYYKLKKRTLNEYLCLTEEGRFVIEDQYNNNPLVYSCGYRGTHSCERCGNCLREYYNTKERIRK